MDSPGTWSWELQVLRINNAGLVVLSALLHAFVRSMINSARVMGWLVWHACAFVCLS